jgi:hypothetical protein
MQRTILKLTKAIPYMINIFTINYLYIYFNYKYYL